MNQIISLIIVVLLAILSMSIVLNMSSPILQSVYYVDRFNEDENNMRMLDNLIQEVAKEGKGATRTFAFSLEKGEIIPEDNSVQINFISRANTQEYLSRKIFGNLHIISGNDVSCKSNGNITMENTFLKIELQKVSGILNTSKNILSIKEKSNNKLLNINDSSIVINDNTQTSYGTGFSELLRSGNSLPLCTAHFYVNSSLQYDIFYTLFSGADFVVVDIKNIR